MLDLSHSFVECNQVRQKSYCTYHCASGRNDSPSRGIQQKRTPDNPDQCCDPESRTEYLRSMHDGCRMQLGQQVRLKSGVVPGLRRYAQPGSQGVLWVVSCHPVRLREKQQRTPRHRAGCCCCLGQHCMQTYSPSAPFALMHSASPTSYELCTVAGKACAWQPAQLSTPHSVSNPRRLICARPCEAPCRDACVDVFNMHKACEAIQCLMPWCLAHQGRLHQHLCRSWSSQRIMHSWSVRYESAWRGTDSAGELTHLRRLKRVGEWPLEHPRRSSGTLHSAPNSIGIRTLRLVLMECLANPPDSCPNKTP